MAGTTDWKVAFKKAVTWGTAVAVGALDGIKIVSEGLSEGIPEPIDDANIGDALKGGTMQGNVNAEGPFAMIGRFEGIERLLAMLMGADAVTIVQASEVFEHVMPFKPSNTGKFGTLVFNKGLGTSRLWEYPSVKISALELTHEGGKAQFSFPSLVNKCERVVANQVNGATQINAATVPHNGLMMIFNQITLRLTALTGAEGNLDSADEILITDLKFSVNRNISGDHESGSNAGFIGEPETDGLPEAQLMFTVANYKNAIDDIIQEANKPQPGRDPKVYKAQVIYTGRDIPASSPTKQYTFAIDLPALTVRSAPVPGSSPGAKVPVEVTMDVQAPQVVPNGTEWAWVVAGTDPFRIRVQNKNSVSMA